MDKFRAFVNRKPFLGLLFDYLTELSGTIGGLFSQILNGEEVSRESAINFLSSVVEEYGKAVLHPSQETEEFLVEEIKKVLKTSMKVYQRNLSVEDKKMLILTVLLCLGHFMGVLIKLFL